MVVVPYYQDRHWIEQQQLVESKGCVRNYVVLLLYLEGGKCMYIFVVVDGISPIFDEIDSYDVTDRILNYATPNRTDIYVNIDKVTTFSVYPLLGMSMTKAE